MTETETTADVKSDAQVDVKPDGKIPMSFQVGDKAIDGATVNTLTFSKYAELMREANYMPGPKPYEIKLLRLRLAKQVTYHINGATTTITPDETTRIPTKSVWALQAQLDTNIDVKAGRVIRSGDGVDTAIGYELGTPIPTGQGKPPITELEFLAPTLGDIEDVLTAVSGMDQTLQLIKSVAKPVHTSLQALPTWAIDQITVTDGVSIAQKVLPYFLGQAVEP
jgi:hypothetical protein